MCTMVDIGSSCDFSINGKTTELNILLVGEEGVGKSSLVNTLIKEEKAPVSNMHTKTWKLTKYSIDVCELTFNFYDIPGIEGKYSDEAIAAELEHKCFDIILCALDGTRIRPSGMVRKSIAFIKRYVPDVPVLFVVTKENIIPKHELGRINEVMSSIRENANSQFRYFGMVSVGNKIPFSKTDSFWKEFITCLPEHEQTIANNFGAYEKDEATICDQVQKYITNDYKAIPEIAQKIQEKEFVLKNMRLIFGIIAYLYVTLCTVVLISGLECTYFYAAQLVALSFVSGLIFLKAIIWLYSTNYYGIFPLSVENVDTKWGHFTGRIQFVSKDKYYTRFSGIVTVGDSTYDLNVNNGSSCMFEICDSKYFSKYSEVVNA